ncbi:MAG TPA: xanthine dehydrogenase family protein subunit M [Steroidobacteraceae bacterium]|jgi:xanthine dehydrogenase YagS FAD-binding subunit|nr:xanthine dehydrogenase family protein subunit M [Steroidobacteraceae bacterium]
MSRDMMPSFELYQPDSLEGAVKLAKDLDADGWVLAGGQDSYDWFKDRAKKPGALIDLSGIAALKGVRNTPDGLEVGALTTLHEIASNADVLAGYALLAHAAARVASPQIRNAGTLGGNLCQDARCWYYRSGVDCYRAGGNTCYADTPQGQNREHCLFGAARCIAVSPSDCAPAVVALEGSIVIAGSGGERVVPAEEFFIGPSIDIRHMTILKPGEIVSAVRLPKKWAGAKFYFEKVTDRATWDFALVNVASAMHVDGGTIRDARIVCGAVECVPRRLKSVEQAVIGQPQNDETALVAGRIASQGATPVQYNGYKIPLMENLVRRAVRDS